MMQKYDLRDNKSPIVVRQREIFFCEFGENIGCEQNSRRPVVILQNNVGNSKSETIVVAPITTPIPWSMKKRRPIVAAG